MSESNPHVGGARYGVSASRACKAGTGGASESTPYLGGIRKRVFVTMPYIGEKKYSVSATMPIGLEKTLAGATPYMFRQERVSANAYRRITATRNRSISGYKCFALRIR